MKVEIRTKEAEKYLNDVDKSIKKEIPQTISKAAFYVQGKVKESIAHGTNAPVAVDTGRFLNSVDIEGISSNEARVFTDIEYAKFIEYGTSKMTARPHFGNTAKVVHDKVKQLFDNEIKAATNI